MAGNGKLGCGHIVQPRFPGQRPDSCRRQSSHHEDFDSFWATAGWFCRRRRRYISLPGKTLPISTHFASLRRSRRRSLSLLNAPRNSFGDYFRLPNHRRHRMLFTAPVSYDSNLNWPDDCQRLIHLTFDSASCPWHTTPPWWPPRGRGRCIRQCGVITTGGTCRSTSNPKLTCCKCLAEQVTQITSPRDMNPFPTAGPLKLVAMDFICALQKSTKKNQFILGTCNRFSKVTATVPLRTVGVSTCASALFHGWILY